MLFHLLMLPFTIFFSLLKLPFTLLHMAFGVLGISTHILLFPLKIFARHTLLCIGIAIALILYFSIKKDPHALDQLKPAMPTKMKENASKRNAAPLVESVSKIEDGDSVFSTDNYAMMTEPERAYYSAVFYKIMSTTPDGRTDTWSYYNIHGALRPSDSFKNNAGTRCRRFTETLKVHTVQQTISGTACDNGGGTWCKLKPNATPACGLGHSPGAFDGLTNAVKNLF